MEIEKYNKKRDFTKTPEPVGRNTKEDKDTKKSKELRFVVQKHDATSAEKALFLHIYHYHHQ